MEAHERYFFTSRRLGFRNWRDQDILPMIEINMDPEVMEYFPSLQDGLQTTTFIRRMQMQFEDKGYCYFAVDRLDTAEFIGFIGLADQNYEADFTPCVDIGWRLKRSAWNMGFAKEGAKRCLTYGFNDLGLDRIYAIAPKINSKSEHIMQVAGMQKLGEFSHPRLLEDDRLRGCILYGMDLGGYRLIKIEMP